MFTHFEFYKYLYLSIDVPNADNRMNYLLTKTTGIFTIYHLIKLNKYVVN